MGAVLLATLEQFTMNLGKFMFLCATVVLLGGFVNDLKVCDFYYVTFLLVSYGIRSFRFLNLAEGLRKPKVNSRLVLLFIVLFVLIPVLVFFVMVVLLLLLLLRFLYSARSQSSFVIIYNMALEIVLALVSLGTTILWLPQHHKYPKSNEFVAMISFFSIVIAESSLFLCIRGCWEIISVRYKQAKKNRDRPRFLLETKSKFFVAVYETTLRDGAIKGLRMNLVDYVANEFLESRGNRELRKSLLMLDAVCHWEEEDQRKRSGKLLLASKREVVERLFECMSHKYYLIYRRAAISLVAEICEDENAFFAVAHVVQASDGGVSLLVKALEPDTNKSVLELLGKLAAFGGITNAEPGMENGSSPSMQEMILPGCQRSRAPSRRSQRITQKESRLDKELQELALDALAALLAYDPSDAVLMSALSFGLDHHDGERSKHTMSILCSLHDQKLLSVEQEKAWDIAKIVDMVSFGGHDLVFSQLQLHNPQ
ncbi:hypothetical protein SELMODRAFT_430176 [Selaginella moellendorffii]|uniref:Uncharacterized protein n=1 Tax=Selaginella moellendorffii TaxID=88036 RepID=D8T8L0_SELML|nr:hypothetical protein SELMODRAFT_430176 [Selaginella moellendorffii]